MKLEKYNNEILTKLSNFLNDNPTQITINLINKVKKSGVDTLYAYQLLLINFLEIDDDYLINEYIKKMLYIEKDYFYLNNPYLKNIHFKNIKKDKWSLKMTSYKPYELFVRDDLIYEEQKIIPQLGFFEKPFYFPAIYQNDVLWMSITPNEINTMKEPINKAFGNVLTFGLGLGYYTYMTSLKDNVNSVTVIEKDANAIFLFKKYILPQFSHPEKVIIIEKDAFAFYNNLVDGLYDFVFVDIYHDVSDGLIIYKKFKETENRFNKTPFSYWIEKSIIKYLK